MHSVKYVKEDQNNKYGNQGEEQTTNPITSVMEYFLTKL